MSRIYDIATGECLCTPDNEGILLMDIPLPSLALQLVEITDQHRTQVLPPDLAEVSAARFVAEQN